MNSISKFLATRLLRCRKVTIVKFVFAWLSVCAVEFRFHFLFCELLRRHSGHIKLYWWATLVFTVAATLYVFVEE